MKNSLILLCTLVASAFAQQEGTKTPASRIYLPLDKNLEVEVEPYKLYEVWVPLAKMRPEESYWIRAWFSGSVSAYLT